MSAARKPKVPKLRRKVSRLERMERSLSRSCKRLKKIDQMIAEQAKIDAHVKAFKAADAKCGAEINKLMKSLKQQ